VTKLLLSLHVLAAIVAVGPVTVAASMFPAVARRGDTAALRTLHRICRVYAAFGVVVPVFGLATASSLGVLTDTWLLVSIVLTAAAAAVLGLAVLPGQAAVLGGATATRADGLGGDAATRADGLGGATATRAARLGMVTGVFNLLWATVVVLMIVRPGSTTGA
jgi:hypothetical protein